MRNNWLVAACLAASVTGLCGCRDQSAAANAADAAHQDVAADTFDDAGSTVAATDTAAGDSAVAPDLAPCAPAQCPFAPPCQIAYCTASQQCAYTPAADATPCSDGNACTTGDVCASGACKGGPPPDCNDANPCSIDACNSQAGCLHLPVAASSTCDDGDACTVGDICSGTQCLAGVNTCQCETAADCGKYEDGDACNGTLYCDTAKMPHVCALNPATVVTCPSGNDSACQKTVCAKVTGNCLLQLAPIDTPCDDGNACTQGDYCSGGSCLGGTNTCFCKSDADCADDEDGNACNGTLFCNKAKSKCELNPATVVTCQSALDTFCQQNLCNPKDGKCKVVAVNSGKACDDGNACTANEACNAGACLASANTCECEKDADCKAKEDGNLCNGTLYCDTKANKCAVNPATVVFCNTDDDPPCLTDACDPKSGACKPSALPKDGTACDDGNPCTPADACQGGVCAATANTCECQTDGDCKAKEDGNLCNGTLYCDKKAGKCAVNPATVVACPDAFDEFCLSNQCDPATGQCGMKPRHQGNTCSDGDVCAGGGWCKLGVCAIENQQVCACKADADCAAFEDGDACNGKLFCDKSGKEPICKVNPASLVVCPVGLDTPCSKNQCQPATGKCAMQVVFGSCDDGKACTIADACANGQCAGAAKPCADSSPCTVDLCQEPNGCLHLPADASPCDDANACTKGDGCLGGSCTGQKLVCDDGNACTADSCDSTKGCVFGPPKACNDQSDCTADSCDGATGKCVFADLTPTKCSDGNPCTDDACDAALGCQHTTNKAPCSDGNACTANDLCGGGACLPQAISPCDDGKVCTIDSCDPAKGCVYAANSEPCDDGSPCTTGDSCKGGFCQAGALKSCNDFNPCTDDSCQNAANGACLNKPNSNSCDDNNACTFGDQCSKGKCTPQSAANCDDGNACTTDSCDPAKSCIATANDTPCNANACSSGDVCSKGACKAGSFAKYSDTSPSIGNMYNFGIDVFANGDTAMTGHYGKPTSILWTRRVRSDGSAVWSDDLQKTGKFFGIAVAGDQSAVAVGVAGDAGFAVRESETGGELAENTYPNLALQAVARYGTADFVACGYTNTNVGAILRLDGDLAQKAAKTKGGGTGEDRFAALAVASDGSIALAGHSTFGTAVAGAMRGWFVRVDADLNTVAEVLLGGKGNDRFQGIAVLPDGNFVLAGQTDSQGAGFDDGWLVAVTPLGGVLWQRTLGGSGGDVLRDVRVTADGALVLAGITDSNSKGGTDGWMLRTDWYGNPHWNRHYGTEWADELYGLRALPNGDIAAVGHFVLQPWILRADAWGNTACKDQGVCGALTAADCDDGNPCTADNCSPTKGCTHSQLPAGSRCGLATEQCTATGQCQDSVPMAEIASGTFWMGCVTGDDKCDPDESPQHLVQLGAYRIDKFEVTVEAYGACFAQGVCSDAMKGIGTSGYNWQLEGRDKHPMNGVTFAQAATYCQWRGARLPTEAEWERAGRLPCGGFSSLNACQAAQTLYPWGNQPPDCFLAQMPVTNGDGCGTGLTAPVGSYPQGTTAAGVADLAGNVAEWTVDAYLADFYKVAPKANPVGEKIGAAKVVRGGSAFSKASLLRLSARKAQSSAEVGFDQAGMALGFRCAKSGW